MLVRPDRPAVPWRGLATICKFSICVLEYGLRSVEQIPPSVECQTSLIVSPKRHFPSPGLLQSADAAVGTEASKMTPGEAAHRMSIVDQREERPEAGIIPPENGARDGTRT